MTREVVITFNGHKYKGLVQDSHFGNGWLVEICVEKNDGSWWIYMGKGRFYIGEIKDWEWGTNWLGKATSNATLDERTPLDPMFKDMMEKAIIQKCLDLLQP